MRDDGRDLLTYSRITCFKTCPRKEWIQYMLGIRKIKTAAPLRFGTAFHLGLDLLGQDISLLSVIAQIRFGYETPPAWADADDIAELQIECEKVCCLLSGYHWRWQDDEAAVMATEQVFCLPIRNPETGRASHTFKIAGKIDKIVERADLCIAIREHKTTGDPIEKPDADYWKRTRLDQQVTGYFWAARELGHAVETIEWDAIHKPGMAPHKATPIEKRKYKKDGDLYANQRLVDEPLPEYAERLMADIGSRPNFYYRREEVPRLQSDIDEYLAELWQVAIAIRQAQLHDRHYRNTSACTSPYRCEYLDVCHGAESFADGLPEGFEKIDFVHPELEELRNGKRTAAPTESTAEPAASIYAKHDIGCEGTNCTCACFDPPGPEG